MSFLDSLTARARETPGRIVLPEGHDVRIQSAAVRAVQAGIASPVLLGNPEKILASLREQGLSDAGLEFLDPGDTALSASLADVWRSLPKHRNRSRKEALEAACDPLNCAALLVRAGKAQGTLAGAQATTADTIRAAIHIIGPAAGVETISSFFIMVLDEAHHPFNGPVIFADCALVVDPAPEQLAEIALMSAESMSQLCGLSPKVGLLSFSTAGSARHARVTKVRAAGELIAGQRPELALVGEIQFDAAMVPEIARSKYPDSDVAGAVNVFVFPSLEAGNIGYKIAQRFGGVKAIGPILQGLSRPANDLSRGCSAEDAYHMLAVTSLQAREQG